MNAKTIISMMLILLMIIAPVSAFGVPLPDRDTDGIPNIMDNCPDAPNTDQEDIDGDGIGDACDETDNRFWLIPWLDLPIPFFEPEEPEEEPDMPTFDFPPDECVRYPRLCDPSFDGAFNPRLPGITPVIPEDIASPEVELLAPEDRAVLTSDLGVVGFEFRVKDNKVADISCTVNSDMEGPFGPFLTQDVSVGPLSWTRAYAGRAGLADGTYKWNVECTDDDGNTVLTAWRTFTMRHPVTPGTPAPRLPAPVDRCGIMPFSIGCLSICDLTPSLCPSVPSVPSIDLCLAPGGCPAPADTTAPEVVITTPHGTTFDAGDVEIKFKVRDDVAGDLVCKLYSDTDGSYDTVAHTIVPVDGRGFILNRFTHGSFLLHGVSEGIHAYDVICYDARQNVGSAGPQKFIVDVSAPVLPVVPPAPAPPPDVDGDGVFDAKDNCPTTPNPGQEDRDGDGFGDACEPHVESDEGAIEARGLMLKRIAIFGDADEHALMGDSLLAVVSIENTIGENLEGLHLAVTIPELGVRRVIGPFDLDDGDAVSRRVVLDIPSDGLPGVYDVRIVASNDEVRRVRVRQVILG